jgi:predicted thioesterase
MKESLTSGVATTSRIAIDEPRTIGFMGDEGRVYATPELVRDIENTCRDFLLQHVEPGEDSVGVHIELAHTAPTLLGMWVEITATVAEQDRRRVTFDIAARDEVEEVARGRHVRFIVDVDKSVERFRRKAAEVGS